MTLQQFLARLTLLPIVLAVVVAIIRWRGLSTNLRYLAVLVCFELPIEIASWVIGAITGTNLFLMPIYTVGEFTLLALMYRQTLQLTTLNKVLPWLISIFTAYALFDSLHSPKALEWFRPGQQVIQSLLILGLVVLYFRKLLNELHVEKLKFEPIFWVSVGLTLYFLGYVQIALFSNYLMQHYSAELNRNVWMVESVLYITLQGCYAYALWMRPQK